MDLSVRFFECNSLYFDKVMQEARALWAWLRRTSIPGTMTPPLSLTLILHFLSLLSNLSLDDCRVSSVVNAHDRKYGGGPA
ncbi:uncharacterized protein BP01DRAFT_107235 [Aspergillus saccharolyticus JOP 1030-1]|uniref:Uncharacterized protein n=1 Tax=Aspergillus saccharolyticus JOP 1030-1 TaxID=1450539 RepID=A0A318ZT89_9EURO|nr:hypothetical protein BP01DRAFT_107235 [Aspergillus saccharolyticus JOP 1030-1]PYH43278.1 hypothetical protein BP01DRAFT_107235 [Aspergillus saccharolyticus JOP 1030-1]